MALLPLLAAGCLGPLEAPREDPLARDPFPTPVASSGAWSLSACPFGEARSGAAPPDLLVALGRGAGPRLERWTFEDGQYRAKASARVDLAPAAGPSDRLALATLGEDAYAFVHAREGGERVLRLDPDLAPGEAYPMARVGALHAGPDGRLYAASDRLVVFAPDLRPLGEVALPLKDTWDGKVAHDALVHDGTAYLLDDVVVPLYVLRVDVRDPSHPRVLERQQISGGQLPGHWLEPATGRWMILQSWGGRGGGHASLHVLPMEGGAERGTVTLSTSTSDPADGSGARTEGYSIRAHLAAPPLWAVVAQGDDVRLGRLRVATDPPAVAFCEHPLDLPPPRRDAPYPLAGLVRAGGFVAGFWGLHPLRARRGGHSAGARGGAADARRGGRPPGVPLSPPSARPSPGPPGVAAHGPQDRNTRRTPPLSALGAPLASLRALAVMPPIPRSRGGPWRAWRRGGDAAHPKKSWRPVARVASWR